MKPFDPNKYGNPQGRSSLENVSTAAVPMPSPVDKSSKSVETRSINDIDEKSGCSVTHKTAFQEDRPNSTHESSAMPHQNKPLHIPGFDPTKYGLPSKVAAQLDHEREKEDLVPEQTSIFRDARPSSLSSKATGLHIGADPPDSKGPPMQCKEEEKESSSQNDSNSENVNVTEPDSAFDVSTVKPQLDPQPDTSKSLNHLPLPLHTSSDTKSQQPNNSGSQDNISTTPVKENIMPSHTVWNLASPQPPNNRSQVSNENCLVETTQEALKRVQLEGMKKLSTQSRNKPEPETTSLRDLSIARRPPSEKFAAQVASRVLSLQNTHAVSLNSHYLSVQETQPEPQLATSIGNGRISSEQSILTTGNIQLMEKQLLSEPQEKPSSVLHMKNASSAKPHVTAASINPVDASTSSGDSMIAMGRENMNTCPSPVTNELKDNSWNNKRFVPPVDWDGRPMFEINTPEFKNAFNNWANSTTTLRARDCPDTRFVTIPSNVVKDINYQADGISMVPLTATVNTRTASYYGYECEPEIIEKSHPITVEEFNRNTLRDPSDKSNPAVLNFETTELLVQTWLAHNGYYGASNTAAATTSPQPAPMNAVTTTHQVQRQETDAEDEINITEQKKNEPKVNIYVRPAVRTDLQQLTAIYNWYVENSPRTAEASATTIYDMEERFDYADAYILPFLVAILRGGNSKRKRPQWRDKVPVSEEKIIGWACAQDFSAKEYVERITAELEIYVENSYRKLGVADCLMDRLLESVDHGHTPRGGYPFHCAQEVLHQYTGGGQRDLHKLLFLVRTFQHPKKNETAPALQASAASKGKLKKPGCFDSKRYANSDQEDDREDDLDGWLHKWLESWGFEVEGTLKGTGVKNGRYLNMTYFARTTWWAPEEGKIPDSS